MKIAVDEVALWALLESVGDSMDTFGIYTMNRSQADPYKAQMEAMSADLLQNSMAVMASMSTLSGEPRERPNSERSIDVPAAAESIRDSMAQLCAESTPEKPASTP